MENQIKKEKEALKNVLMGFGWLCVVVWGFYGTIFTANPYLFPLGILFVVASLYLGVRLQK